MWPTPTASFSKSIFGNMGRIKAVVEAEQGIPQPGSVGGAPERLPTPAARDYRSPNQNGNMADQLPNAVGGSLNADWVELLMGFSRGWTDLGAKDGKMEPPESQRAKKTE